MRREWIEIPDFLIQLATQLSPSMRREWIEMKKAYAIHSEKFVSLHAEGVD